jgi:hypothetical protein
MQSNWREKFGLPPFVPPVSPDLVSLGQKWWLLALAIAGIAAREPPRCAKNDGQRMCAGHGAAAGCSESRCDGAIGIDQHGRDGFIALVDASLAW